MTSTESEAASYEFTTLTCIPGVIEVHTSTLKIFGHIQCVKRYILKLFYLVFPQYKGANIQLLDLPGIIEGAAQGTLRIYIFIFCHFKFKVNRDFNI